MQPFTVRVPSATLADWRVAEARLNALPQFRTTVGDVGLHLVHARSTVADAVPLLLTTVGPARSSSTWRSFPA
ncbi:MAG: epoxide hydrolase N-terminal domain-containing protein [Gemmatimonadales bacterium]|nr:epoxide hydrolase N-terminal domain-containing protein [Gemmatimonadales bacterium]